MMNPLLNPTNEIVYKIAIAIGLGAFLGIRREIASFISKKDRSFMGLRTMIMISLLGAISTFFTNLPWLPAIFFVGLISLVAIAYTNGAFSLNRIGLTSECSALLTFWVGVLVGVGETTVALVLSVILAYLNGFKLEIQKFVETLNVQEWNGAFQLILLSGCVLPFLPETPIDPWGVIIPYKVWLVIVLISGLGFLGYFLVKYFGARGGIPLMAFLGSIVSSTGVTTSIASKSKNSNLNNILSCGILIALATMQIRVTGEILLLASPELIKAIIAIPIFMGITSLAFAGYFLWRDKYYDQERQNWFSHDIRTDLSSPFEIKPALIFGIIFIVVLLSIAIGQQYLGDKGIYMASVLSAAIDIDAIVLSSIQAVHLGDMTVNTAKNALVIAIVVNTIIKLPYIAILGSRALLKRVTLAVLITSLVGVASLFLF